MEACPEQPPPPPASHPPAGAPGSSRSPRRARPWSASASSRCSSAAARTRTAQRTSRPRLASGGLDALVADQPGSVAEQQLVLRLGLGRTRRSPPARRRPRPTPHEHALAHHRFKAMGCEVVVGGATLVRAAPRSSASSRPLEASLSRFRPDSDLERLNRSPAETIDRLPPPRDRPRRRAARRRRDGRPLRPHDRRRARGGGVRPHVCGDRAGPPRPGSSPQDAGARSISPASSSAGLPACGST